MFTLHPRIKTDSHPVIRLALCEVRLGNDSRYPWVMLIPARADITEVHQLSTDDQHQLLAESQAVSEALERRFSPKSINVAALGNVVSQLHWHVVARSESDAAWPAPIWGVGTTVPYNDADAAELIAYLRATLTP